MCFTLIRQPGELLGLSCIPSLQTCINSIPCQSGDNGRKLGSDLHGYNARHLLWNAQAMYRHAGGNGKTRVRVLQLFKVGAAFPGASLWLATSLYKFWCRVSYRPFGVGIMPVEPIIAG